MKFVVQVVIPAEYGLKLILKLQNQPVVAAPVPGTEQNIKYKFVVQKPPVHNNAASIC